MSRPQHNSRMLSRGFTLVEVVVVLAIAAILAGVSVPTIIPLYNQQKTTERQADAELIYTTAQNNMAKLKASGLLSDGSDEAATSVAARTTLASTLPASYEIATQGSATSADDGLVVLSSDNEADQAALALLLPSDIEGQLSDVGFGGLGHASDPHYVIELNPVTGYVYSAFYSEDQEDCDYSEGAADNRGDEAVLASMDVAYYGGGTPKTFEPSNETQFAWVGYFEFSKDGSVTAATSGYFYQVTFDGDGNATLGNAQDYLHNDNTITEGAVDSSDGTAYGVLVSNPTPSGFVAPSDVSTTTYEVTNSIGVDGYATSATFYKLETSGPLTNGVGAWHPWTTASGASDDLRNEAFYVDQNFAAAINEGTSSTLDSTYQVRTDDQLQHIGTPYDWTAGSAASGTEYLGETCTFNQTHAITINQTWYPIGQKRTEGSADNLFFGGTFNGHDLPLTIAGDDSFSFSSSDAYGSTSPYRCYGVFGATYHATIRNVSLSISGASSFSLETPHFGMLVGHAQSSTIIDCSFTIPSGASLAVTEASMDFTNNNTMIGGMFGEISGSSAAISDCKLTVASGATLTLASEGEGNRTHTATNTGGFAGRASSTSTFAMKNCTFELAGTVRLTAQGNTLIASNGGFIGASMSSSTIDSCKLKVTSTGNLYVGSPNESIAWEPSIIYTGGFIGRTGLLRVYSETGGISESTKEASSTVVQNCTLSVASGGSATVQANYSLGTHYTGGFSGAVISNSSLLNNTLTDNGTLAISGNSNNQSSGRADTGGFIGLATVSDADASQGIVNCVLEGSGTPKITAPASSSITVNAGGFAGRLANETEVMGSQVNLTGGLTVTVGGSDSGTAGGFAGSVEDSASISSYTDSSSSTSSSNVVASQVNVGEDLTVSAIASKGTYAGGFIGNLQDTATLTAPIVTVTGNLDVSATAPSSSSDSDGSAYSGGLLGSGTSSSGMTVSKPQVTVSGNASIKSSKNGPTYSGGIAGYLESVSLSSATDTVSGILTVQSTDNKTGHESYAAGFIGYAAGTFMTNGKVSGGTLTVGSLDVSAETQRSAYAGGFVGRAYYYDLEHTSFSVAETSSSGSAAAISTSDASTLSRLGGFAGSLEGADVSNSYVATRNAALELNATGSASDAYAGGFAGSATTLTPTESGYRNYVDVSTIADSYVAADISSTSNNGISGFVDYLSRPSGNGYYYYGSSSMNFSMVESSYVIGTLVSRSGEDAYAFTRTSNSSSGNMLAYDYAAVLDGSGSTSYDFAGDSVTLSSRCFTLDTELSSGYSGYWYSYLYRVSYPYLTSTQFVNYFLDSYGFVSGSRATGDAGSVYGLSGTNPFPTATQDADGNYVNYGKWFDDPNGSSD